MLRFIVRRLLLLIPILFGLSILVFVVDPRAARRAGAGAARRARDAGERSPQIRPPVRARPADLRAVLGLPPADARAATSASASRRADRSSYEFEHRFPATIELALAAMLFAVVVRHPARLLRREAATARWFDHVSLVGSLIGISIPIFFLALILKYIFAVRLGWLPSIGREDVTDRPPAPDELLHPRRDHRRATGHAALGRDQAPDPARDRARLDPARDHRAHHARRRARRPERGLRPHRARQGHVAARSSTGATCCATRCCRSSTIIGLQTGLLLSGAVLTETVFAWPGHRHLARRTRSSTATTRCSRAGSSSSRSSSCSSTCSSTSRTRSSTRGSGCR